MSDAQTSPEDVEVVDETPLDDAGAAPDGAPDGEAADLEAGDPRDEEIASLRDKLARARADYVNLQRRVERDAALERERVKARVLESFLQVFEYGRMAEIEANKNPGPLAEGVKMIVREFERLLEGEGVKTIGTIGDDFDQALHEALGEEEGDVGVGAISRVVAPGYLLGERVLRYAKVMVQPDSEE